MKATTVILSNKVCSTFTAMSSLTLLSDHVQWNELSNMKRFSFYKQSFSDVSLNFSIIVETVEVTGVRIPIGR
jgi:hypothetical protein